MCSTHWLTNIMKYRNIEVSWAFETIISEGCPSHAPGTAHQELLQRLTQHLEVFGQRRSIRHQHQHQHQQGNYGL